MKEENIKKVHVVYKTHLDIGFTDLAENVVKKYHEEFIPKALELAEKLNKEQTLFVWTTGSWLINQHLKYAKGEYKERFEQAIRKGFIRWHGIPFTTHTELMDQSLFRHGLDISKKLDKRYGKKTIAAKMTDVPGHTIGIVPILEEYGIQYLHLGVNPSSRRPKVPKLFLWEFEGSDVIINYADSYGQPLLIDGFDEVLEFAHSGDNSGPPNEESILKEVKRLQEKYPNAEVLGSSLDAYAEGLIKYRDRLPIVREELGDTWIHGVGTDPIKVARYKELLRLKDHWINKGLLDLQSDEYNAFMDQLLLIPEHTWGMDFKKYLGDYVNWAKEDFKKAREKDVYEEDKAFDRFCYMSDFALEEFKSQNKDKDGSRKYSFFEQSHEEQRDYINKAIDALNPELQKEAKEDFAQLKPSVITNDNFNTVLPEQLLELNNWTVSFNSNGAISYLKKGDKEWVKDHALGMLTYEIFDATNYHHWYNSYNVNRKGTYFWSEPDFSKPGIEYVPNLRNQLYSYSIKGAELLDERYPLLQIHLIGHREAVEDYGCPKEAVIRYRFMDEAIAIEVNWFNKDANKLPEALWFSMNLNVDNPYQWKMHKLGHDISPINVVKDGNRYQHAIDGGFSYEGSEGVAEIQSLDAPLVSIGDRNLMVFDNELPRLEKGFHFNLYNNKWGTNFKMWFEEDCKFRFILNLNENIIKP